MNRNIKSLIWASMIIATAIFAKEQGLSDGASYSLIVGMMAAAFASLGTGKSCRGGC